jgi:hypothetical protein
MRFDLLIIKLPCPESCPHQQPSAASGNYLNAKWLYAHSEYLLSLLFSFSFFFFFKNHPSIKVCYSFLTVLLLCLSVMFGSRELRGCELPLARLLAANCPSRGCRPHSCVAAAAVQQYEPAVLDSTTIQH